MATMGLTNKVEQSQRAKQSKEKYSCECGVVVPKLVYENEQHLCPKCGGGLELHTEEVDLNEKRSNCPRCGSSYPFQRNINECAVCNAFLEHYAPTNLNLNKDEKSLPYSE